MKGISASEVARCFTNAWVFNYGPPTELVSDNGGCFTSKFFIDICRIMSIKNNFTTTYHPQANGQVERYNRTILAALRTYVADHPRDWDLYTDALTFAYNCQPHSSTDVAPFDLVLSKPPGPLALKPMPREDKHPDFKRKWKHWLQETMHRTKKRLAQAQARYKRDYDRRLRRQDETIQAGDHVYLRVERKNAKDHRHKLAPVAEGPYRVSKSEGNTVVIELDDRSVERVSRSRVVLAPKPQTSQEAQDLLRPVALPDNGEVTNEEGNLRDIVKRDDKPPNKEKQATEPENQSNPEDERKTEKEMEDDTEEFVIDSIVAHKVNKSRRHRFAKHGENLYQVRWYGFNANDDTWEPVKHLPRSKVLTYFRQKGLEAPRNINDAIDG